MLTVSTLGIPHLDLEGTPLRLRGKPLALLCWLAVRGEGVARAEALELLWPGESSQNLRQTLYTLRKLPGASSWLTDGETLGLEATTDLLELKNQMAKGERDSVLAQLTRPFLEGLETLPDPFLEWLEIERHKLALLRRTLLFERALELESHHLTEQAVARLEELLKLDALHESATREVMRLEAARGRKATALGHFEALREGLWREMGAVPLPETLELAGKLIGTLTLPLERGPAELRLLQVLALLGEADPELLSRVLERDSLEVADALGQLENAGDVVVGRVAAQIPLHLNPHLERLLHGKIAAALEGMGQNLERSGAHFLRAAKLEDAVRVFLKAGAGMPAGADPAHRARLAYRALWAGAGGLEQMTALYRVFEAAQGTRDFETLQAVNAQLELLAFALQNDEVYFQLHLQRGINEALSGPSVAALEHFSAAYTVARRMGSLENMARVRLNEGGVHYGRGELERARGCFQEALEHSSPPERVRALSNLAAVWGAQGQLETSLSHLEEALTLARLHSPKSTVAAVLLNLAITALNAKKSARALEGFRESVLLYRESGSSAAECLALSNLTMLYLNAGALGEAWNTAQDAIALAPNSPAGVLTLQTLGAIEQRCGRLLASRTHYATLLERATTLQNARPALVAEVNLALLDVLEQQTEPAPDLLARLKNAGLGTLAQIFGAERRLVAANADTFLALEHDPNEPLSVLAQTRAFLKGWISQPPDSILLEQVQRDAPVEAPYALSLRAALLEHGGDPNGAAQVRKEALELRQKQAEGLPKTQRSSFLAWDATSLEWVNELESD